jgi:uncharacterized membrane protein YgaE (UPF0421/DUF939 family)
MTKLITKIKEYSKKVIEDFDDTFADYDAKNILALIEAYEKLEAERPTKDEIAEMYIFNEHFRNEIQSLKAENQKYRAALEFYSSSSHIQDLKNDLENPSGEPANWVCDSDDKFNLENGEIARQALKEGENE